MISISRKKKEFEVHISGKYKENDMNFNISRKKNKINMSLKSNKIGEIKNADIALGYEESLTSDEKEYLDSISQDSILEQIDKDPKLKKLIDSTLSGSSTEEEHKKLYNSLSLSSKGIYKYIIYLLKKD